MAINKANKANKATDAAENKATDAAENKATDAAAAAAPAKSRTDFAGDIDYADWTASLSTLDGTPAAALGIATLDARIERLSRGVYVATVQGHEGTFRNSATGAVFSALSECGLKGKDFTLPDLKAYEAEHHPLKSAANKGDNAASAAFWKTEGEATARMTALAGRLSAAADTVKGGERSAMLGWHTIGGLMADALAIMAEVATTREEQTKLRAQWLADMTAPGGLLADASAMLSKNTVSKAVLVSLFDADAAVRLANTPAMLEKRVLDAQREFISIALEKLIVSVGADGKRTVTLGEHWRADVTDGAYDLHVQQVAEHKAKLADYAATAARNAETGVVTAPLAPVVIADGVRNTIIAVLWANRRDVLCNALERGAEALAAKVKADAEADADGDATSKAAAAEKAGGTFAAMPFANAVQHLWAMLRTHPDARSIAFELVTLADAADAGAGDAGDAGAGDAGDAGDAGAADA